MTKPSKPGTDAEYARHRKGLGLPGGTRPAVKKALAAGHISAASLRARDYVTADADWLANTRPSAPPIGTFTERNAPGAGSARAPSATPEPPDYQESRARREAAEADIAEQKAAILRGDSIRLEDARQVCSEAVSMARASLEVLPIRLPDRLVGLTAGEMRTIIRGEVESVLQDLTKGMRVKASRKLPD